MKKIAFKSEFGFEGKAAVPVGAVLLGAYITPEVMRASLGPLSYLAYKPATFSALVRVPDANGAGQVTVKLNDGTSDLASIVVDLTAAQESGTSVDVDLAGVTGATKLRVIVDVGTAADVSTEITVDAKLAVEQPLVMSGCA